MPPSEPGQNTGRGLGFNARLLRVGHDVPSARRYARAVGRTEHWRGPATALLASLLLSCGDTPRSPGHVALASPSGSGGALATPACVEGARTCAGDDAELVCEGGARVSKPCAPGAMCLAHACVPRAWPDGASLPKERLRRLGDDGFLNGWSTVTPLAAKAIDGYLSARDPASVGGAKAFRPTCARDGFVTPRPRGVDQGDGQVLSLASGVLFSDEARSVRLWASVAGKLRVRIGGDDVLTIEEARGTEGRPLVDERSTVIALPRGASDVSVVLEAPPDAARVGGFYLRLRELSGSPVQGVAFAERYEGCSPGALLDPGSDFDVDARGLFLHLNPAYHGLVPAAPGPFPLTVELAAARDVTPTKVEAPGDVRLAPPARGGFEVRARLGDGPSGEPLTSRTFPAYAGLVGRVAKLVADATTAATKSELPAGSRDSLALHAATLAHLVASGDADLPFLERRTKSGEELASRALGGTDPYAGQTGVVYRAYRSRLDEKLQPYIAFVPKSQKRGKPQPLVVVSHGRNRLPEHALRTLVGEAPDDHMTLRFAARNLPAFPDQGAILVAPWGYDEGGPHPLGEDDLLRVVGEMSSAYAVDPRRVSLTGYSLGGTVAFVAPLHYPDVFSASAPLCGYPNLLGYSSVAGVPHAPWEDALLAKKYIVNYAENGAYLPLNVVHGGKDVPGRSKVVVDRYKSLGYSCIFDVQEDLDHDVWDYAYEDGQMVAWLTGRARPAAPKRVRFATGEYRYDRAYWLRIVAMRDGASATPASVDAALLDKEHRIHVSTAGVDAFVIDRASLEPKSAFEGPIAIDVDGQELTASEGSAPLAFQHGDAWALATEIAPRPGHKRHGVSGPLDDVLRHPVVVVYGTQIAAHGTALRLVAEHMRHAGGIAQIDCPMLADTEATDERLRGKSLVLVGGPDDNAITKKMAGSLPVRFEGGEIVVRDKHYRGEGVGVSFIAPRPDDPDEYVVVHAGLDEAGLLASRFLPRYLPDYVVYDARTSIERSGLLLDQRPYLAGGFFSEAWD